MTIKFGILQSNFFLVACVSFAILSCDFGNDTTGQGGPGEENAVLKGNFVYDDGKPASGALAKLVPSEHDPYRENTRYQIAVTDDRGQYAFDSLETGFYNLYGEGNKKLAFQDSIYVDSNGTLTVKEKVLREPGSISGVVRLQGQGDNRRVIVIVMGSNMLTVPVDSGGHFRLENLAEGEYQLRFFPTRDDFDVLDTIISVKSAQPSILSGAVNLPYTGIPTPSGLEIAYDTATQTATLTWDPVDTARIRGYNVYRSAEGSNFMLITPSPVGKTQNAFRDVLVQDQRYEYRVVSINSSGKESEMMDGENDTVFATPFTAVQTRLAFSLSGDVSDSTTGTLDTVLIKAIYENPVRSNVELAWYIDAPDSQIEAGSLSAPFKTASLSDKSGADSIKWYWEAEGQKSVTVKVTDSKGSVWKKRIGIRVVFDSLRADAGRDTTVNMGATVKLRGSAAPGWGSIAKWEWNINGAGFIETSGGDTGITVPERGFDSFPCILRATDNHGYAESDTVYLTVGTWRILPEDDAPLEWLDDMLLVGQKLHVSGPRGSQMAVKAFTGTGWEEVGGGPIEETKGRSLKLAYYHDALFAAYATGSGDLVVKRLEGDVWRTSYPDTLPAERAREVQLAGNDSALYVIATQPSERALKIFRLKDNVWAPMDSGYNELVPGVDDMRGLTAAVDGNTLSIAFTEDDQNVTFLLHDIATGSWRRAPTLNTGLGRIFRIPFALWDEKPVLITNEGDRSSGSSKLVLKRLNGGVWEAVGQSVEYGESPFAHYLWLEIAGNTPFLSFLRFRQNATAHAQGLINGNYEAHTLALINGNWETRAPIANLTSSGYDLRMRISGGRIVLGLGGGPIAFMVLE